MNAPAIATPDRSQLLGGSDIAAILGISPSSSEVCALIVRQPNYVITSVGRVFSIRSNRFLTQSITTRGYAHVKLGRDNWHQIHRLVAEAFIPNVDGKPQINHIDGNPLNNAITNLEWVTGSENMRHAYETGLQSPTVWTIESKRKLSQSQLGHAVSAETRRKISEARTGIKLPPRTEEHKRNIREALRRKREGQ